ncbi:hypothetical protein [Mycoplasma parvum]|uniref:Uncharacterized protein n=1 Tax=Mycoplasma parvum str. Indiana TaxID=1403316 RepID=U5NG15_9MOLU|nr:hypothetical protein [Mycoplasma parvum]AGX89198.1 hypothetical protein PRV_02300 [Mycoplasma parvum str. Indiana]
MVRTIATFALPLVIGGAVVPTSYAIWGGRPLKDSLQGIKNVETKEAVFTDISGKYEPKKYRWNFGIDSTGILSFARGIMGSKAKDQLNNMSELWNGVNDNAEEWKKNVKKVFQVLMGELWEKHLKTTGKKYGQDDIEQFKFRSQFKCNDDGKKREGCTKQNVMLPMAWWGGEDGKTWSARVEFAWKIGDLVRQNFKEFNDKKRISVGQVWEKIITK